MNEKPIDPERLKRVAFEKMREYEQLGTKRPKLTFHFNDKGILQDVKETRSIK